MDRRTLLSGTGAAALLSLWRPVTAAGQTIDTERANLDIVNRFCAAWATRDIDAVLPFLADDCVYRMTETTPPAMGHVGVTDRLASWLERASRVEFRVLESFAKGPIVLTHRRDQFIVSPNPLRWEGVGVFFLTDGRIKEWSDYTIRVER